MPLYLIFLLGILMVLLEAIQIVHAWYLPEFLQAGQAERTQVPVSCKSSVLSHQL
jgi:hypothetical protein